MIRSYLGYIEMIEMITRRLTKIQKAEILEAYRAGDNTNSLAEKYSCTSNTINRTVKTLLSDAEYKSLKKNRSKLSNKKENNFNNESLPERKEDLEQSHFSISLEETFSHNKLSKRTDEEFDKHQVEGMVPLDMDSASDLSEDLPSENQSRKIKEVDKINESIENEFELITPLISDFDFNQDKLKSDFQIHNSDSLPDSVYMIVDKKVELELQLISDLPEWSFLPENELQRNAILLFANQRSAKRSCSRNQRVIKIPNTSIFRLSKSYLISKGITRLILEDSIIALDK